MGKVYSPSLFMARMQSDEKNSKYIFQPACAGSGKEVRPLAGLRLRHRKAIGSPGKRLVARLVENIITRPVTGGFDPELLYVECGRCGSSPVLWEDGRATRLLDQAGIDPLELLTLPAYWLQMPARHAAGKMNIRSGIFRAAKADRLRICPRRAWPRLIQGDENACFDYRGCWFYWLSYCGPGYWPMAIRCWGIDNLNDYYDTGLKRRAWQS